MQHVVNMVLLGTAIDVYRRALHYLKKKQNSVHFPLHKLYITTYVSCDTSHLGAWDYGITPTEMSDMAKWI